MNDGADPTDPTASADRGRTSRRAVLVAGAGVAMAAASAGTSPTTAEADEVHDRARHLTTRIRVAPGVEVAIADLDGGSRGTIFFVPGWPLSSVTFESTCLYFADRGYRAIAIDQRGFGRSDAPYGPYDYDVWAKDISKVLRALSLRGVTLVGHSMGGAVAVRHAAHYGGRIGRLVLAEVPVPRFVYGPTSADLAAGLAGLISGYATDRAATVRSLTGNFFATHTDIATDPFLQFFERQCLDQASLQASRSALVALRDTDLTPDLAQIEVPTLVFHALNDKIVPLDHGQAVAAGIRGARLVTFASGGHAVYVDEAEKFNKTILGFIS